MVYTYFEKINTLPDTQINRYLGLGGHEPDEALRNLINELKEPFLKKLTCAACYTLCEVKRDNCAGTNLPPRLVIAGKEITSTHLAKNLKDCDQVVLMCATIGVAQEQLKRTYSSKSPAAALILDTFGTVAIETFADKFCKHLASTSEKNLRPRFSPGYGDLDISLQPWLLSMVDSHRKIGVSLTDGGLMIPQKSISAFIGISDSGCKNVVHNCELCSNYNCEYRL